MATKFANMGIVRKYDFLYSLLSNCTKIEKVAIWAKLGVRFKTKAKGAKGAKGDKNDIGLIPIEQYQPTPNKVDINFYHDYPTKAIPLSKEDAAKVMSTPVTPLKGSKKTKK